MRKNEKERRKKQMALANNCRLTNYKERLAITDHADYIQTKPPNDRPTAEG